MTTLALGGNFALGFNRPTASEAGKRVWRLEEGVARQIKSRADQSFVFDDLVTLKHEQEEGGVVNQAIFLLAERFLLSLHSTLPAPELSMDPDGEIAFDWFGKNGEIFSVSLGASGRLSYAGKMGGHKSFYGTDKFEDVVPREITAAVWTLQKGAGF